MTIKTIDRAGLRMIQDRVLARLKDLETELGVTFSYEKGMVGGATGSLTLGLAINDASGSAQSLMEVDFKAHAAAWSLSPDDLGRTFMANGKPYTLVGARSSAHRYPLLGKSRAGTLYKFPADTVRRGLTPKAPPIPAAAAAPAVTMTTARAEGAAASAMQNRLFG